MERMDVDQAKYICMMTVLNGDQSNAYTAACALMARAHGGNWRVHWLGMSDKRLLKWLADNVQQNCAMALEEYAKAFPNG